MGDTAHAGDSTDRAAEAVDATHITGDVWFINRYGSGWYMAAVISAVLLAPVGVPLLAFLLFKSLHRGGDPVEVYPED